MTTKNFEIPAELIKRFAELTNEFESAIRTDERQRIYDKMTSFTSAQKSEPQRARVVADVTLTAGHHEIKRLLSGDKWLAVPTIAGLTGKTRNTIYTYLRDLRASGVVIDSKTVNGRGVNRRGYSKIFRLAKAA